MNHEPAVVPPVPATTLRFRGIIAGFVALIALTSAVYCLLNPGNINHIVVINQRGATSDPQYPLTVVLEFEGQQHMQRYETGRLHGDGGLDVFPWKYAFFGGTLRISDARGMTVTAIDLQPPARYSRNLVILLTAVAAAVQSWNSVPVPLAD